MKHYEIDILFVLSQMVQSGSLLKFGKKSKINDLYSTIVSVKINNVMLLKTIIIIINNTIRLLQSVKPHV